MNEAVLRRVNRIVSDYLRVDSWLRCHGSVVNDAGTHHVFRQSYGMRLFFYNDDWTQGRIDLAIELVDGLLVPRDMDVLCSLRAFLEDTVYRDVLLSLGRKGRHIDVIITADLHGDCEADRG